ncbi:MAG TPA: MarR family transcriptional regulator [Allosphingosinicella sp.]|jgi:DNA-binding MarR family transcriptional regulator
MAELAAQETAERLQAAAARLLRLARQEGGEGGTGGPRLSALSVLVLRGPLSLGELAAAEQVKPPTISRVVDALVRDGLATREAAPGNRRKVRIAATEAGTALLRDGRAGRVRGLAGRLARLADSERRALARAVEILERALR